MVVKEFEKKLVEAKQGVLLPVLVSAEGKQFALVGFDEWANAFKVKVKSKAEKGKANQELVREIQKIFSAEAEIVKGEKSKQKTLLLKTTKKQAVECLSRLLGNQRNA